MLDLVVLLVMFLCAFRGYQRGAIRNVLELLALAIAWVASAPLWHIAGNPLIASAGWTHTAGYLVGRLIAGAVIYVPLVIGAWWADKRIGRTPEGGIRDWNRALGTSFGLAVGILTALFVLFLADTLVQGFPASRGTLMGVARRSSLRKMVAKANPARRFMVTDVLQLLTAAKRDPAVLDRLLADPQIRSLMEHPKLRAAQADQDLAAALRDKRIGDVLENESLGALLGDAELRAQILSAETRKAIRNAVHGTGLPPD